MKRSMWIWGAAIAVLSGLLYSCRTAAPPPVSLDQAAELAGVNPTMMHRAAQFRQYIIKHAARTGVVLDEKAMAFYVKQPEKLAARCKLLGFSDAYIAIPDPKKINDHPDELCALLRELHRAGIQAYASLDLNYLYGYDNSITLNPFADGLAVRAITPIMDFNASWKRSAEERFDGIETVLLPYQHISGINGRTASLYNWNEKQYGPNGENNILIRQTLDLMHQIREKAADLVVAQNIGHDFHDRTLANQLSRAGVNNFLDFCDFVIIDNVSNDPDVIMEHITPELRDSVGKESVAVRIITSQDFYSDQAAAQSFSRNPWLDLVKDLHRVCREGHKYPSFRGLVFDDFLGLEACWERTH